MKSHYYSSTSNSSFKIKRISPDKGPQERWQHATQQIKLMEEGRRVVVYALEESIVDALFFHKLITRLEREAALKFRHSFMAAGMSPHTSTSYDRMNQCSSSYRGTHERTDHEEAHYKKWRTAMVTMGGAVNGVVESTICYDQMPAPEKIAFLRVGLKKLIKLYGLSGVDGVSDEKVNQTTSGQVTIGRRCSGQSRSRV